MTEFIGLLLAAFLVWVGCWTVAWGVMWLFGWLA
jgi:hypothetical protein